MLKEYKRKRNFSHTPEPAGKKQAAGAQLRFVVQRHEATRLHYDFRLELDGVLKSWAVPKGPSMNPADKRLAVHVEDHPVDYIDFKGTIPAGNYGAGKVEVWDHGQYIAVDADLEPVSEKEALQALKKGELKFFLKGNKISGGFVLVRLHGDDKNWLLIKHKDEYASNKKFEPDPRDKKGYTRAKAAPEKPLKPEYPEPEGKEAEKKAVAAGVEKTAVKRAASKNAAAKKTVRKVLKKAAAKKASATTAAGKQTAAKKAKPKKATAASATRKKAAAKKAAAKSGSRKSAARSTRPSNR
ncbi:MAG: DNA polymerase ligase N-terminal domain-containing protein [Candidatus Pseudobacter hemicellulosilyticus]|uniref:DNA polymerase ligase N-terminal domain-containing protein n=1 Tax=Candidatus Pseudobacter hemicellulosilyticus TaxID=3121375 RepID=A0AAJ5WN67_9BACT|nr:MAG: DNA polymerase ligase N-terminal domain-containing protein [Pseudobacter sp.]